MKRRNGAAVMVAAILVAATARAEVVENAAAICFDSPGSSGLVAGHINAQGCYSSSCTHVVGRQFSIAVDSDAGEIRVTTRFELEALDREVCTMDCGGAGTMTFDLRHFEARAYRVFLGDREIGRLDLSQPDQQTCL